MKNKISLVACVLAIAFSSVAGQTAREIRTKYGRSESVYSVSEHLWMTPAYGANGRLCMMRLYPKRISVDANYFDDKLEMNEVLGFINELFPSNTRGARKDSFGTSDVGGGIIWTRFNYDRVRFVFISSFSLVKAPEPKDYVLLDFPIDETAQAELRRNEAMQSDDQLIRKHAPSPQLLEIYWANRKCVKP
jgi:hypothetical protein